LLGRLAPKVARYKLPKRVFFWAELPQSGYGKITKKLTRAELDARGCLDAEDTGVMPQ
jgi:acyl-CoA synthetase (AMP-forming)/AMP-acid ligase II